MNIMRNGTVVHKEYCRASLPTNSCQPIHHSHSRLHVIASSNRNMMRSNCTLRDVAGLYRSKKQKMRQDINPKANSFNVNMFNKLKKINRYYVKLVVRWK